ncbi:hypothetical protein AX16_009922 [Volvariella volvacea WC 439]|nr:hypothetical protein AX16_009922 [Volvariella volvacea WC 439]
MAAVLAEISIEDLNKDAEDDVDFVNDKEEEDMFESDFASTDEEAAAEVDEQAAEKEVEAEERYARKQARSKLERVTQAAHERHKATFNPQAVVEPPKPKPKPRVTVDSTLNSELAEAKDAVGRLPGSKRKSQRSHTVLNTTATVQRIQESGKKAAIAPKKPKTDVKVLTQAELIARALDNEEGNLAQHRDYLQLEEEKRKRARVVRTAIEGPVLRWISRVEKVKVVEQPSPPPPPPVAPASTPPALVNLNPTSISMVPRSPYAYTYGAYNAATGSVPYSQAAYYSAYARSYPYASSYYAASTASGSTAYTSSLATNKQQPASAVTMPTTATTSTQTITTHTPSKDTSTGTSAPSTTPAPVIPIAINTVNVTQKPVIATSAPAMAATTAAPGPIQRMISVEIPPSPSPAPTATPAPIERIETVEKNYIVHELNQRDGVSKPPWGQTMRAMFGEHVNWEEIKVYIGKGRPLARPQPVCPITGLPAKYKDPRSGVPYADSRAFRILTQILKHEYVWSKELGCYVGRRESGDSTTPNSTVADDTQMDTS